MEPKPAAIETVTVKGASVAIYYTPTHKAGKEYPGHTLVYTEAGKRKRQFVTSLDKAKETAKSIARQLSEGTGHVQALTPEAVADYTAAIKLLRQHPGIHLTEAVSAFTQALAFVPDTSSVVSAAKFFQEENQKKAVKQISVEKLVEEFLAAKISAGKSPRYIAECKSVLKRFKSSFRCNIAGITTADLQGYLDRLKIGPRSRDNHRVTIVTLFSHARKRGYLPREISTEAMHVDRVKAPPSAVEIYQPADLAKTLAHAEGLPQLAVALGAFSGLRTAEICRLDWKEIGPEYITVAPEKAKTSARRLVPILPSLKAFLDLQARGIGRIFKSDPTRFSTTITDTFRAAGVEPVHNGLRHSFCTYRLADIQNTAQVALEAGNSPVMLFKHYRELATKKEGKAWFTVAPEKSAGAAKKTRPARKPRKSGKVIPMPAQAA